MQFHQREVNLKLNLRPLRLVYLARDREDLLDAVALFTHVWGGAANPILPMPISEEEATTLKSILESINPDYIFTPADGIPSFVSDVLESLSALTKPISKSAIDQHIQSSGLGLLRLSEGTLSHVGIILRAAHSTPLDTSNIRVVNGETPFQLETSLYAGLPSQVYQDYLIRHLAAKRIAAPISIEQLVKLGLLLPQLGGPMTLTRFKTRWLRYGFDDLEIRINDPGTLCLFLDDGVGIDLATVFWNSRWTSPYNKLFLPKNLLITNIEACVALMKEFMPSLRALFVVTLLDREGALSLQNDLKKVFETNGHEVLVRVAYHNFPYSLSPGFVYSGTPISISRFVNQDKSVRFEPPAPFGHENLDYQFGYDLEIRFATGRELSLPNTRTVSLLLTNELWRIEQVDQERASYSELWLRRDFSTRAARNGIAGTILSGREARFFLHSDDTIISRYVKDAGFEIRANKHTRYVQGCIKRFGGFDEVIKLFSGHGSAIVSALVTRRAEQGGLFKDHIKSFLTTQRSMTQQDADSVLKRKLEPLLASELVRRGYGLDCPTCNLKDWYSLAEISEFIKCKGCAENFQLPTGGLQFTYKLNELAARLVLEGGLAVLMVATFLKHIPYSGLFLFGGDLLCSGEKTNFAEVDLLYLTENTFILVECKSFDQISETEIAAIRVSLSKCINAAISLHAQVVILGVSTNSLDLTILFATVAEISEEAAGRQIALHLVLNGVLYPFGREGESFEPREIKPGGLQLNMAEPPEEWFVGESPQRYRGTDSMNEFFKESAIRQWDEELSFQNH